MARSPRLVRNDGIEYLGDNAIDGVIAMSQPLAFDDILDAAEQLDPEAQAKLMAVLTRHLAEPRASVPAARSESPFASGSMEAFLRGMGSVLEFFPPPERFNAWRAGEDVSLGEWPVVVRDMLAEPKEDA